MISDYLKIDPKNIIAFGDEHNDLEMLEISGNSIAMENAAPAVKKVADKLTKSNQDSGVAFVLKEYLA